MSSECPHPVQQGEGRVKCSNRTTEVVHSRTSSGSSADGLLLSVSALAGGGSRSGSAGRRSQHEEGDSEDNFDGKMGGSACSSQEAIVGGSASSSEEVMGVSASRREEVIGGSASSSEEVDMTGLVREEPEGANSTSYLAVDRQMFGRLQDELTSAQSELKLKEEQVTKLSRIRDDVEAELEDLTASLFEEANKMVIDANVKRAQTEKALVESEMKVEGLQTEVSALKTLVITSTPSMPNRHLHPHIRTRGGRGGHSDQELSAPNSPVKDRSLPSSADEIDGVGTEEHRNIDPVLRAEYLQWKKKPNMDQSNLFFSRIYREDILPCLDFPSSPLADQVIKAVQDNTLCLSPIRPDTSQQPRNCSLLLQPRTCRYKLVLLEDGNGGQENFLICQLARNRIAAVCDFLTYCRYVTQGMVKSPCNDVYWEVMNLRRQMNNARLGFA